MLKKIFFCLLISLLFSISNSLLAASATDGIKLLGSGSYVDVFPVNIDQNNADNKDLPAIKYISSNIAERPIPTNDWWSSLVWEGISDDGHYVQAAHPFLIKLKTHGMKLFAPGAGDFWVIDNAYGASMANGNKQDFILGNSLSSNLEAYLDDFNDWFVTALMKGNNASMRLTYGHGSPYVYAIYDNGNPTLSFESTPAIWYGSSSSKIIGFSVQGRNYAAFAPQNSNWSGIGSTTITCNLPANSKYFTIAALPAGNTDLLLPLFEKYAYNHISNTTVHWDYIESSSEVVTTYNYTITQYEGDETGTIFGLYPHQWRNLQEGNLLNYSYTTARGEMKLASGLSFKTSMKFPGVMSSLPPLQSQSDISRLYNYVDSARNESFTATDTYYVGKRLGKLASIIPIAEQVNHTAAANEFRTELQNRLENWFDATNDDGSPYIRDIFYYNNNWKTLIGYDASFGSADQLNDHHFHYGYFIKGAAEITRTNRNWGADSKYGSMVNLLIRDIASTDRNDSMFPFLRNFDIYAGHSWASGHARFGDGNNNESSSEAMNAWTALILWGEYTNNPEIKELGIYLYTTEMNAINEYWFNIYDENYPDGFNKPMTSLVWGCKQDYATWFSGEPEAIQGIILLPIQAGSLYLGHDPDYAEDYYNYLVNQRGSNDFNQWDAIFYAYEALFDPDQAMQDFYTYEDQLLNSTSGPTAATEEGNTVANTYHWIRNLQLFGQVDHDVVATNHALYAVFKQSDGTRNYTAYNPTDTGKTIIFSDGMSLYVAPHSHGSSNGSIITDPLPAPTMINAAAGDGQVTLSWSTVSGADSYKIYYGTSSNQYNSVINVGNITGYTITGLNNNTDYYFAVTACNSTDESAYSNEFTATPQLPEDNDSGDNEGYGAYYVSPTEALFWVNDGGNSSSQDHGFVIVYIGSDPDTTLHGKPGYYMTYNAGLDRWEYTKTDMHNNDGNPWEYQFNIDEELSDEYLYIHQ